MQLMKSTPAMGTRSAHSARRPAAVAPVRAVRAPLALRAHRQTAEAEGAALQVGKVAALSAVASTWAFSGNAQAAVELANVAASDSRLSTIAFLFLPALGWVGYNMLQPTTNQLSRMSELKEEAAGGSRRRGVAGAVGLGAALSMLAAQQADAATELSQLAASDNRLGTISLLFLPALGWVAFNILQPLFNQLTRMSELKDEASTGGKRRR